MANIRVVIFDFDGVIIESADIKTWAFGELFRDEPAYRQAIVGYHQANGGISRMAKIRHIYAEILRRPLSEELFQHLCDRYAQLVFERVKACPFVPGALEFLKAFHGRYSFYVVSGTPHEEILAVVRARGLALFFKGVYGSPQTKTVWVHHILNEENIPGGQAAFVGDALADHEAALANGTHFIARVPAGATGIFTGKDVVSHKLEDLRDLPVVIDHLYS